MGYIHTVLSRPAHWDALRARSVTPADHEGRYSVTLACGCQGHFRQVLSGRFAGNTYGDAQYHLCDAHALPDGYE